MGFNHPTLVHIFQSPLTHTPSTQATATATLTLAAAVTVIPLEALQTAKVAEAEPLLLKGMTKKKGLVSLQVQVQVQMQPQVSV